MAGTLFGIGSPTLPAQPAAWGLGPIGVPLQSVPIQLQQLQALQHYQLQQIQQLLQVLPQQIQQVQQLIQLVPQQVAQLVHQVLLQTQISASGSGIGTPLVGPWASYPGAQSALQSPILGIPYQTMPGSPGASFVAGQQGYVM
jgi:hypothetical protein